jgi:hypothetical protein
LFLRLIFLRFRDEEKEKDVTREFSEYEREVVKRGFQETHGYTDARWPQNQIQNPRKVEKLLTCDTT